MSTTARRYWLKTLRLASVKHFRARSGLGLPYICYIGDFAGEAPFIEPGHSVIELRLMAEWCRTIERPVVFDVGANNGFIATQLAQLLKDRQLRIYSFEPVPSTYAQLKLAVESLRLDHVVIPVCCAVSDSSGITTLAFNPRESLFAQVRNDTLNARAGTEKATAAMLAIDQITSSIGLKPDLLKIDVEGWEPRVLQGAAKLLADASGPAICLEWNPATISETGASIDALATVLEKYRVYYVDDFIGQKMEFGEEILRLKEIDWICNVFAVPRTSIAESRWNKLLGYVGKLSAQARV